MYPILTNSMFDNPVAFKGESDISAKQLRKEINAGLVESALCEDADCNIALINKKNVIKASNLIEDMWSKIRKGELMMDSPMIHIHPRKGVSAILRPIYGNNKNEMCLSIGDTKKSERIYIDRYKCKDFRYEKVLYTDYGSATVKYVDSTVTKDKEISRYVNSLLRIYLSELFPADPMKRYSYAALAKRLK